MLRELEQPDETPEAPGAADRMPGIISEVLETMFFTESEPAACEHAWLEPAPCVRVRFEGSHSGELLLALSADAADPVAAAFLGLEPSEVTDVQRAQVIEELANMVCGALLSHLWPESRLALAPPELAAWQESPADGLAEDALHRCFVLPEGLLAVSVHLNRSSVEA